MTQPRSYPGPRIVVARDVGADPQTLYAAWTDPEVLATWWWPGLPDTRHTVDATEGGRFEVSSQVASLGAAGHFTRLEPPSLVQLAWRWESGEGQEEDDLVTISLTGHSHGTLVVLTHEIAQTDGDTSMRDGWIGALDALAATVGRPAG
ncbi:SRPBCC domain-containing protein [uncultured Serinicoccus sp.]|uniref:SRPBCC family protein n=1 Tax=uncultured Serinicoccus sp. TaxID=735514 RepID=UPI002629A6D7|nr:SRPBCC family protein [uncultured Serinicoccus sp.]